MSRFATTREARAAQINRDGFVLFVPVIIKVQKDLEGVIPDTIEVEWTGPTCHSKERAGIQAATKLRDLETPDNLKWTKVG